MKKLYSLMLLCAAIIFATGCSKDDDSTSTPVSVSGVTLDKTTLSIEVGGTSTLIATVSPDNAADKSVAWSSDKTDIATVTDAGVVTGVAVGTATITVTTADGGKVATCQVTVTAKAIEWAEGNLVAKAGGGCEIGKSTDKGLFFQFGSLIGWSTENPLTIAVRPNGFNGKEGWKETGKIWQGEEGTVPFTVKDSGSDNEKAGIGDPCRYYLGDPWRLPTKDEYAKLFNNVTNGSYANSGGWSWNDASKSATHTDGSAFPASGYRKSRDGSLNYVGTDGYYWSASPGSASYGYILYFYSSSVNPSSNNGRAFGLSVRCVKDASN